MARPALLRAARGFFVASTFSLPFVRTLISQFSSSRRMFLFLAISFSLISVWALVYGAVSFLAKDSACDLPRLLSLSGLEISLVSETTRGVSRGSHVCRGAFLDWLSVEGGAGRMRRRAAELRSKCGSGTLRRRVTERRTAFTVSRVIFGKKLQGFSGFSLLTFLTR